MEYLN
jgi:hypothetical protein